jgi:hypothetical protein
LELSSKVPLMALLVIMLWLEIQEGNSRMKSRAFVGGLGANAACALRIALGVIGAGGILRNLAVNT